MTDYQQVIVALHALFATLDGFDEQTKQIKDYEPSSVVIFPFVYSLLDSFSHVAAGGVRRTEYRTLHRFMFRMQQPDAAELSLKSYLDPIIKVVDDSPHLAVTGASAVAFVEDGQAVWVEIGGTKFRVLDVFSRVIVKKGRG